MLRTRAVEEASWLAEKNEKICTDDVVLSQRATERDGAFSSAICNKNSARLRATARSHPLTLCTGTATLENVIFATKNTVTDGSSSSDQ